MSEARAGPDCGERPRPARRRRSSLHSVMDPLRIACVRYLNTAPLIEGLEKLPEIELSPTVPSRIAGMVRKGEADVGLVSLVDSVRGSECGEAPLALLPVGMIGCDGPTMTVRLYSSVSMERIGSVHVDTDSHTSVILCQILLHQMHGIRPQIVDFDVRERIALGTGSGDPTAGAGDQLTGPSSLDDAWPETVLLIGDKVVTDAPPASSYPHQLDLGAAWKERTGLPFVYAMWACRAEDAGSPRIQLAASLLDRQLRHNATRLDWIVSRRAPDHRWPVDVASTYLKDLLRFRVGARERKAAELFIREASALGLVQRSEPLWADAQPSLV